MSHLTLSVNEDRTEDGTEDGFSLVELVLVVALISVLGGMFIIIDPSFVTRNDVELSGAVVTESLRRARTLSVASQSDSQWGVHVEEGSVVIFKGNSYEGRDVPFDEETVLPSAVVVSGMSDFIFSQVKGGPVVPGTVILSSDQDYSVVIEVNEKGAVLH